MLSFLKNSEVKKMEKIFLIHHIGIITIIIELIAISTYFLPISYNIFINFLANLSGIDQKEYEKQLFKNLGKIDTCDHNMLF